jgi:hypothetical protein
VENAGGAGNQAAVVQGVCGTLTHLQFFDQSLPWQLFAVFFLHISVQQQGLHGLLQAVKGLLALPLLLLRADC